MQQLHYHFGKMIILVKWFSFFLSVAADVAHLNTLLRWRSLARARAGQNGDAYALNINVGDLRKDELNVVLDKSSKTLIISGAAMAGGGQGATQVGSFSRSFSLPADIRVDALRCTGLRDGMLSFQVAKAKEGDRELIESSSGGGAGSGGGGGGSGFITSSSMTGGGGEGRVAQYTYSSGDQVVIPL